MLEELVVPGGVQRNPGGGGGGGVMRGAGGAAGEGAGGGVPGDLVTGGLDGCVLHVTLNRRNALTPPAAVEGGMVGRGDKERRKRLRYCLLVIHKLSGEKKYSILHY